MHVFSGVRATASVTQVQLDSDEGARQPGRHGDLIQIKVCQGSTGADV